MSELPMLPHSRLQRGFSGEILTNIFWDVRRTSLCPYGVAYRRFQYPVKPALEGIVLATFLPVLLNVGYRGAPEPLESQVSTSSPLGSLKPHHRRTYGVAYRRVLWNIAAGSRAS